MVKVAALQCDIEWENAPANRSRFGDRIEEAASDGARLILLPEMFPTGFSMAPERFAEDPDGLTATFLHDCASRTGSWVAGSFACLAPGRDKPTNRFLAAGPRGEEAIYDKIHPFSYGGESDHYAAGDHTVTFSVDGLRVTPFICYDLRFGDWFWRTTEETDCYAVVANWPTQRQSHWVDLLRARAIENLAYVVGVNRVGSGGGVDYSGGTVIFGPFGSTVAFSSEPKEETVTAEVDRSIVDSTRSRYPFIADR